jgi:riboflavin kinase/FMN adenylyltransferase
MIFGEILTGKVVSGRQLGSLFGFPTVNVVFPSDVASKMDFGVYAGHVVDEGKDAFSALIHFGPKPTLDDAAPSFEVFFLDFPQGRVFDTLSVRLLGKLREVQKFDSLEALGAQIEKDRQQAVLEYFSN